LIECPLYALLTDGVERTIIELGNLKVAECGFPVVADQIEHGSRLRLEVLELLHRGFAQLSVTDNDAHVRVLLNSLVEFLDILQSLGPFFSRLRLQELNQLEQLVVGIIKLGCQELSL
jgi:hypothetical protein